MGSLAQNENRQLTEGAAQRAGIANVQRGPGCDCHSKYYEHVLKENPPAASYTLLLYYNFNLYFINMYCTYNFGCIF